MHKLSGALWWCHCPNSRRGISPMETKWPHILSLAIQECWFIPGSCVCGLRLQSSKNESARYCFAYNNLGNYPKGRSHICQHCQDRHSNNFDLNPARFLPSNITQLKPSPRTALLQITNNDKDQIQLSTPVHVDQLSNYLEGYDPTSKLFLTQGFTAGFHISYEGPRKFCFSKNLSSLKGKKTVLIESIHLELAAGRIAGPFSETPFPNI